MLPAWNLIGSRHHS